MGKKEAKKKKKFFSNFLLKKGKEKLQNNIHSFVLFCVRRVRQTKMKILSMVMLHSQDLNSELLNIAPVPEPHIHFLLCIPPQS